MAQLIVRNLDLAVKEGLRRRAQRHGHSMEEEARLILRRAVENDETSPRSLGLGSRIAALFTDAELDPPTERPTSPPNDRPIEPPEWTIAPLR